MDDRDPTTYVKVYGSSDDLIEVEGAIDEEFPYTAVTSAKPQSLLFSDGTWVDIVYTGVWAITIRRTGPQTIAKHTPNKGPDSDQYSDVLELEVDGFFDWVVCGHIAAQYASANA